MFIVINMKTFILLGEFASEAEADAAHEANPPAHTIRDFDFSGLTNSDLVRIYNARPGVKPVARFADRAAAERRVRATFENPSAEASAEAESPLPTTQETAPMARKSKKPAKTARKPRENGVDTRTVTVTPAGSKDDLGFHEGSPRSKIFAIVKRAEGGVTVSEVVKRAAGFADRGQVIGALGKLKASKFIKIEDGGGDK